MIPHYSQKASYTLLEKVEIPTKVRDEIYFFSNRDDIRDRKSS
jgi:hypothetical protein